MTSDLSTKIAQRREDKREMQEECNAVSAGGDSEAGSDSETAHNFRSNSPVVHAATAAPAPSSYSPSPPPPSPIQPPAAVTAETAATKAAEAATKAAEAATKAAEATETVEADLTPSSK